jgi:hypothetical protein
LFQLEALLNVIKDSNIEQDGVDDGIYGIHYIGKKEEEETAFRYFPYKICRDPPVGHIAVNVLMSQFIRQSSRSVHELG